MSESTRLHRDLTVQKVIDASPSAIGVFLRRRMACVGCAMAPFVTVAEAAASYGIPVDELETELREAAARSTGGGPDA